MYPGWMVIGANDPFGDPLATYEEIVNSARAHAYARLAGLCWLYECEECDSAITATPGFPFDGVAADPAPWYDANDPDSESFLGVIGMAVDGADNSTRQANVTMSTSGIGVIGPTYMGPRTLVVRALAIASDDCGLQYGLTWLRGQYNTEFNPCGGDALTFFDCCPCMCPEAEEGGPPCWATNYNELGPSEPACNPEFWPTSYNELIQGPPNDDEWCAWPRIYNRLIVGPPTWSCCIEACIVPYFRQFLNVRVTEGPIVLNRPKLYSGGAVAEIEFTITCGDPRLRSLPVNTVVSVLVDGGEPVVEPMMAMAAASNPYVTTPVLAASALTIEPLATDWVRMTLDLPGFSDQILLSIAPRISIRANGADSGPVRLGLWAGDTRIGGYTIPFVSQSAPVIIDGRTAFTFLDSGIEALPGFVQGWDSRFPGALPDMPHGEYTLTVDQDAALVVPLYVDVETVAVGAA